MRARARRRLPRVAFDFIDGGADAEVTLPRNLEAFERVTLAPAPPGRRGGGEAGVAAALEILRAEIDRALALLGRPRLDDIDASVVRLSESTVLRAPQPCNGRTMDTSGFRLVEQDEFPHPPDDASNFNESVYMNAFDPRQRLGGFMRLGNRVNEGYAELSVCLYLPGGRVACQFQRPKIERNDGFEAGGMRYECVTPFERQEMRYDGEVMVLDDPSMLRDPKALFAIAPRVPASVSWTGTAVSPVHGGEPTTPEQETLYGPEFSRGHFNQHTRNVGTLRVGDEEWAIDGFGWRDHSWGPRYWQVIYAYRLLLANFGSDRAFMLLKNIEPDGHARRLGVVLADGEYEDVVDLEIATDWSEDQDPERMRIGFRTPKRQDVIEARVLTLAPLRNRRRAGDEVLVSRIAEGFTEFTWGDRTGYGIAEYIERVEDGAPVGYPL